MPAIAAASATPSTSIAGSREYALDSARGALMSLGVLLHVANIYEVAATWEISDPQRSGVFDFISWLIHEFRMESFYWISGYFCAMTFWKRGVGYMLQRRMFRVGVPLVTTWLTLNVAQEVLIARWRGLDPINVLSEGVGPMHLWFLLDLLIYLLAGALLLSKGSALLDRASLSWKSGSLSLLFALTAVAYLLSLLVRGSGMAYIKPFGIIEPLRLASYFPYFAAGMLMYRADVIRRAFFGLNAPAMLAVAVPLSMAASYLHAGSSRAAIESGALVEIFAKWMLVSGVIGAFQRWASRPGRLGNLLADASYTVYLFHHSVVVALGILVMPLAVGPYLKFVGVTVGTLVVTAAIHQYVIRPTPLLRLLYNGRPLSDVQSPPSKASS
ncbi:MAG: acyltransferase family protein [Steroidobacteraceae bacterium]